MSHYFYTGIMTTLQTQAAELFNITLSDAQAAAFDHYAALLTEWNERINLTAIIEPDAVRVRHFLDSLSVVQVAPMATGMKLIDVGTGAGFPGIPLAIAYPDVSVMLMESTGKKVDFLDLVADELDLANVYTLRARAEEAGHDRTHRGQYDLVLARAVARMPALMEYLLPLARVGGRCVAMKGITAEDETKDATYALKLLGGKVERIESIQLPDVEDPHYLVVVQKTDATPKPYPRNPGTPTRKPLIP